MLTIDSLIATFYSSSPGPAVRPNFPPARQLYTFSTDLWGHLSEHSWRATQVNVDEIEEREKCYIDDTTIYPER